MTDAMWKNLDFMMRKTSSETVVHLIQNTAQYRHLVEEAILLEESYNKLELTEMQKNSIDRLLEQREIVSSAYSNLTYLAGGIDCMTLLRKSEEIDPGILERQV